MEQTIPAREGANALWQEVQEGKEIVSLEGLSGPGKAFLLARLFHQGKRPVLILTPEPAQARELYEDLAFFLNPPAEKSITEESERGLFLSEATAPSARGAYLLPEESIVSASASPDRVGSRLETLDQLSSGRSVLAVAPLAAALRRVLPRKALAERTTFLEVQAFQERGKLEEIAIESGYRRVDLVEEPGEFAVRGAIFDIYSPGYANPLRIELDDEQVESIREFDPFSQKSVRLLEKARLLPMQEFVPGGGPARETLFDYLPANALIVLDDASSVHQRAARLWEMTQARAHAGIDHGGPTDDPSTFCLDPEEFQLYLEAFQLLRLLPLGLTDGADEQVHNVSSRPAGYYQGRFPDLASQLGQWQREGYGIVVACLSRGQAVRLKCLLEEYGVTASFVSGMAPVRLWDEVPSTRPGPVPIRILTGRLSAGFLLPDLKAAVLIEDDVFGMRRRRPPTRQSRRDLFLSDFANLKQNDYVVHVDHGIGQYLGIAKLETGGNWREFLEIEYAGGDKLYIPLDRLGRVQKFIGANAAASPLSKLGHPAWKKTKERVLGSLRELARDLLRLYAARQISGGYAFSPDNHWHQEFDALFEYEETPHQLQAIQDVKADMEQSLPMDRLVCGDVGYGKTEVAMRAAFKAVTDGKQVAVLVPTTILAQQHLHTFRRRFSRYPIRIEVLSRFKSPPEQKAIIRGLREGSVHVVIGTHRLLQKDIELKELGLLVIDEEQRFGVTHKEKLKQLRKNVDVLTLTATPIPRTLSLSLLGLRNISIIETPPEDRLPIQTCVRRFNDGVIREAILRELERDGQVYFVHNRVENIQVLRSHLQQLVPPAKIAVAHGQMNERELEEVMLRFLDKEFNVLLSTSIIESGLDIPSVNTILINRADHFGLAQLYQLRGRVGRDRYQAYAYLLIPEEDLTSEVAKKRLQAVKELSALGSGFQLASKDMEIRGAGNILGHQQSGQQMSAVGFELYCNLLEESIRELKGDFTEGEEIDPEILLQCEGYVPEEYIANLNQRLDVYKRLSDLKDPEAFGWMTEEIEDRYGALPDPLKVLLRLLEIKAMARKLRIVKVEREGDGIFLSFSPYVILIPFERYEEERDGLSVAGENVLRLRLTEETQDGILNEVKTALQGLMAYITV